MRVLPSDLTPDFCGGCSASSQAVSFSGEARHTVAVLPPEKKGGAEAKTGSVLCSTVLGADLRSWEQRRTQALSLL